MCLKLMLNHDKFELIYFNKSSKSFLFPSLALPPPPPSSLSLVPSPSICSLGFILDAHLSLSQQILSVSKSCYFHLHRIKQHLSFLDDTTLQLLISSLVHSRITVIHFILVFLILHFFLRLKFLILLFVWLLTLPNFCLFLLLLFFYIGFLWDIEWRLKYVLLCLKFTILFLLSIWIT